MAKSQYEYVRNFEEPDPALLNCWMVVRIDGKGFHKFTKAHDYEKPNDAAGLNLMNACAEAVFREFSGDVIFAFGESDEFSFVIHKDSALYDRRKSKIATLFASCFASNFVFKWSEFFPNKKLQYPPLFDGRVVLYPSVKNLRDYLSWRQVDTHINNLYNTCFWNLVKSGKTTQEAEKRLSKTLSDEKQEILFTEFGINYNNEPPMFKKGSILFKKEFESSGIDPRTNEPVVHKKKKLAIVHEDIISDNFWAVHSYILSDK